MPYRIFIVEDHRVMRDSLILYIGRTPWLEVCGAVASAEEALVQLPESGADLVLVDISLPGMNGIDLIKQLRRQLPALPCLILSGHVEERYAGPAAEVGAVGYVMKDDADALIAKIQQVLEISPDSCPPAL